MVLPRAHRADLLTFTPEEWSDTLTLIDQMIQIIESRHNPAGYNIGWNVGQVGGQSIPHAHCHLLPRYVDDTFAGHGIRFLLKQAPDYAG